MNIKTFMVAAVAALSVAACCKAPQDVEVPADEAAAAQVELNADGSVKKNDTNGQVSDEAAASLVAPVGQQHQL